MIPCRVNNFPKITEIIVVLILYGSAIGVRNSNEVTQRIILISGCSVSGGCYGRNPTGGVILICGRSIEWVSKGGEIAISIIAVSRRIPEGSLVEVR